MTIITDDYMKEQLALTRPYTAVILKKGPKYENNPDIMKIIWEHARRNFSIKADGMLPVVCPVNDGSEISGIGIFTTDAEETKKIMEEDPGVQAGIFIFEIHPTKSFPGSLLPA
jgi:hypothetical protein